MKNVLTQHTTLAKSSPESIEKVQQLTDVIREMTQLPFVTEHLLHAGMYTRTVRLPANAVCTAVLISPATVLIIAGSVDVWSNDELITVNGYNVIPGSAGRKIAFVTRTETAMSMLFPCKATTVEEAQREFSEEHQLLPSLALEDRHRIAITGE